MRDILIEFLETHLKQQQQLSGALAVFLGGLTGKLPTQYLSESTDKLCHETTSTGKRYYLRTVRQTSCSYLTVSTTREITESEYKRLSPEAKKNAFMIGGDEENSQTGSGVQNLKSNEEEEHLKYLSKRTDGRWCARRTIDGKRICVYGRTQAEAYEKLRQIVGGGKTRTRTKAQSFVEFANWWLVTFKKDRVSIKTYKSYQNAINNHLQINTPLNRVTAMQLQEIIGKLPATRIKEVVCQVMKAVMRKAYELDLIKKDMSAFIDKGKIKRENGRQALNLEEQRKLIGELGDDTFARRVMFYLCTGVRPAEIATIRKDELRPGWVKINGTKTQRAVRWVKISAKLEGIIAGSSEEFFKFDNKRFRERLQKTCRTAGIEREIDVYTLRHTFATNLYILRVPEKDRQTYMGHTAGSTMTNDVYTTFSPDTTPEDIYNIFGDWLPKF